MHTALHTHFGKAGCFLAHFACLYSRILMENAVLLDPRADLVVHLGVCLPSQSGVHVLAAIHVNFIPGLQP